MKMSFPDYVVKLIDDHAKLEQFVDYRIEFSNRSKRGENFTGLVTFIAINGTRYLNGLTLERQTKNLVLKLAPANPNRRKVFQVITGFKCEVEMYTNILPMFVKFQSVKISKLENEFLSFPKVFAAICDQDKDQFAIIMEDLSIRGYKMFPKLESITYDHAKLVMNELAKYHAISFALKDQDPKLFQEMIHKETLMSRFMKDDLGYEIIHILDRSINILENEKHKDLVRDLKVTYADWVEKFADDTFIGGTGVILHGDCWSNNVLYQYNENEENRSPSSIMFLDWQMSRYGPPLIDLFYFLLATTNKSFRDEYFIDLLNGYHASLSASIEKLGSDPKKLYSFSTFQCDMKKFNRFPLLFALVSALFRSINDKHILDLDEYADRICKGEGPKLISDLDIETETLYKTLLNDAVADVVEYCDINL